jgi:hypothetical protein
VTPRDDECLAGLPARRLTAGAVAVGPKG